MFSLLSGNKSDKKSATKVGKPGLWLTLSWIYFTLLIVTLIPQQPQSPKEQPKKGDQKGDDNKKQGGKHLHESTLLNPGKLWSDLQMCGGLLRPFS